MTTYLLITSDKPKELTAFVGPKKRMPNINDYDEDCGYAYDCRRAEERYNEAIETAKSSRLPVANAAQIFSLDQSGLVFKIINGDGPFKLKLDTPVELEGWVPEIVYQYLSSRKFYRDAAWIDCDESQYNSLKSINLESIRQAYRLKRSEPHTLSNAAKNIVDQSIVKVNSDEYNQFKADRKRSEPVTELPEECQDPLDSIGGCVFGGSSKNYCKKCVNESPIEAKTQERSMEDLETPFSREIHRDLIVFLPLMTKGEMKPEFNLGYVSIVDGKRVEINMAIQVESHKTQESQEDLFHELFGRLYDTLERGNGTMENIKKEFILTRRNP